MRIIIFHLLVFICINSEAQYNNDIAVEIEFTNVMTGAKAKYKYAGNRLKVYKSKEGNTFRLIASKRIKSNGNELITDKANQLLEAYNNTSANFNSGMLDGFAWDITIKTESETVEYKIENCYNKYIDNIISVMNKKLKRKRLIIETGLMYSTTNQPCE
ncbi:MAG TPA: hypothetical protein DDX98_14720 [Bacteroidales bacterium]|nr:hypothetical protein [Bacteroidales bacterium]